MNFMRSYNIPPDSSLVNEVIASKLARRGDTRDVDDISDTEFNELYLEEFSDDMFKDESESQFLAPRTYDPQSSSWIPHKNNDGVYKLGDILKNWESPPSASHLQTIRATAAIARLQTIFGQDPRSLVVMLLEISPESLDSIMKDDWAKENFILSDTEVPSTDDGYSDEKADHFTLMMISRNLPISNCFRETCLETDGKTLVVDIPVSMSEDRGPESSEQSLRLCTTHLGRDHEDRQYELISVSDLLAGFSSHGQYVLGGLVGGNLAPLTKSEKKMHRNPDIDLKDVWEHEAAQVPAAFTRSGSDVYARLGGQKGHTWGYHSDKKRIGRRLDTFLYTDSIETVALEECQHTSGKLGRFGMKLQAKAGSDDIWVSEHFGIAVGIKVV
ncbi:hypothetical protein NW768_011716 [Fusarium equiseti]|uniref:Uncharacterized protein n=1 Tax=Fusarium equiseti TaxID=61235 RepID=A0ABQ8QX75_FUSEQ|nr:hypothetical protein NW768_011716 [Fusarium equiseti]